MSDELTSDLGKRMTDRMTSSERDQSSPDSEPRDAATIMLIDRAGPQPKVLLGRRHAGHKFMPGKFVFPGGRIEAQDRNMQAATELHPDTQAKLLVRVAEPSAELARGFALAAVREMAEETGSQRKAARQFGARLRHAFQQLGLRVGMQFGRRLHVAVLYFDAPTRKNEFARHELMAGVAAAEQNLRLRAGAVDEHNGRGIARLAVGG